MSVFSVPDKKLFFSKNDPDDLRLGDVVTAEPLPSSIEKKVVVVGYPDDRGIQANGGRAGAKEGPTGIRSVLYKLVAPNTFRNKIIDIGDFSSQTQLPADQVSVIETLDILNKNKNSILSLGGGHDWAYCDVSSFLKLKLSEGARPLVINIDAHLDVRSDKFGVNSGTPFYKLLEGYQTQFDLVQIGIQPFCNSKKHIEYCQTHSVKIYSKEMVEANGIKSVMNEIVSAHQKQPVFLSLDIDAIDASQAPGCSQSWPAGLSFPTIQELLKNLSRFSSWNHLGIYEVSPPLDIQNLTQKCAALAAYEFFSQSLGHHGV